jgi:2-desacetyl-2-hydroxyethyl bacteriochlorophyllide A dehydrogenase
VTHPASRWSAVIDQPRHVTMTTVPNARPGPDQVSIALLGSGVCASSLPLWQGRPWFEYPCPPGSPGHEAWGIVDRVGEDVDGLRSGQHVVLLSDRAFAEQEIIAASRVVPLPDGLGDRPFPGEPLACALNAFARGDVREGHRVAIVGAGFLGTLLCRLCELAGASVTAVSRRRFALDLAQRMGASVAVRMSDPRGTARDVAVAAGGAEFDRVFEAAGVQETLDLATALTATGGRLMIAGYHQDGLRSVDMQAWNWKGIDVINAHERDSEVVLEGVRGAIDLVATGQLDPTPLYTHVLPLAELGRAFALTEQRPDGFMKALVVTGAKR